MIPLLRPTVPDNLSEYHSSIDKIIASGMLTNSKYTRQFEKMLVEKLGSAHCIALSCNTLGQTLFYKYFGITGGEILLPSFTFVATAAAICWAGAKPKFVDCDLDSFNISVESVEQAISKNTKAIVVPHIFGNPSDISTLEKLAKENGLLLLFDSAHALGAKFNDKMVGTFGNAEVFSFTPTKIITTGEGGVISTKNADFAEYCYHAIEYGNYENYDCRFIGTSGRMSEFNSALGVANMKMLDKSLTARNRIAKLYTEELSDIEGVHPQQIHRSAYCSYQSFGIRLDQKRFGIDKFSLQSILSMEKIQAKVSYFDPPVHKQKAYQTNDRLPNTEKLAREILCLPIFMNMTDEQVLQVTSLIRKARRATCLS